MTTVQQPVPVGKVDVVTFWEDFEEMESFVRAITFKVTRRHKLDTLTFQTCIDDLLQAAWETLLEQQATDPLAPKRLIISRIAWAVQRYIWNHVFSLYRDRNGEYKSCLTFWKVAGDEFEAYDADLLDSVIDADQQPLYEDALTPEEVLTIEPAEKSAEIVAETFTSRWSDSSFLFHRVRFEEIDAQHPELEHALYILLCATQLYLSPHQRLLFKVKRRRAYIMMRRMQGANNVTIGGEQGRPRLHVGADVQSARRMIDRWLKLRHDEQLAALNNLYTKFPAVDKVSMAYCNREGEVLHPHNVRRLNRAADIILRHTFAHFGFGRMVQADLYDDLKQLALLHLIVNSQAQKSAKYAYSAAKREVKNYILFQVFQKDPRHNRERDKHLALDIELENIDDFGVAEGGRLTPAALMLPSPERVCIQQEWNGTRDRHWQKIKGEIIDIIRAMQTKPHTVAARQSAVTSADCMVLRLRYGYSMSELGRELGISSHTAKTMVRTTRKRLQAFLAFSEDEKAARLLRAYFSIEPLNDVPEAQLQQATRSLHVQVGGESFIIARRTKRGKQEVYLIGTRTYKAANGGNRSPQVYVGLQPLITPALIRQASSRLCEKFAELYTPSTSIANLPLAGD
ncbi:MAG: hypothetical protein AAF614_41575 [Chloroflexota bacterium]